ncbi:MAG: ATP-binding cassette domain-containing protein, partial [Clostridia bacterium]
MATVVFERVSKSFGRVRAVDELSFTIREGTILGLLGPNGSGKSTMLKLIAGLYRPDAGRVTIDGQEPSPKTKAMVAYLPEIDYLYGWMTLR